jgi:hypothetical protein
MVTSGQIPKGSDPCLGMSPHGFLGIEATVVQRISNGSERQKAAERGAVRQGLIPI